MGFLSSYGDTYRMKVGPVDLDYYIEVREHISHNEREAAEKALSEMKVEGSQVTPDPDVMRYRRMLVLAHIKEWNLDDDGGVWPIDDDHIGILPDDVFDQVWKWIDSDPGKRDKDEQRRFPDGHDVRDQVGKSRTRKLAEVPA